MEISIQKKGLKMVVSLLFIILSCNFTNARYDLETVKSSFNTSLYKTALDNAECERQLSHIRSDLNLRLQFLEAGLQMPKFLTQGNTIDLGNYHGCLGINQEVDGKTIQGKYCMINVPTNQEIGLPDLSEITRFSETSEGIIKIITLSEKVKEINKLVYPLKQLRDKSNLTRETSVGMSDVFRSVTHNFTNPIKLRIAVCIPKPCTISEGLAGLLSNAKEVGFQYEEEFCRLPNDKPWAPADYVAIVVFSVVGIITVISTLYDLRNQFILRRDSKSVNPLYTSFSMYTNARRLTTFSNNSNALECVDGIRALSMAWVNIIHVFYNLPPVYNVIDYHDWKLSTRSIWITSAPLAVDTFLMMSGMLLVYANAGKLTGSKLIRNLHLFYLNRILRMFPLLAASILMQASFFHWMSDGPLWQNMAVATDDCRNYWWLSMLYVNNFFNPICHTVSWYLAVDMQLHILSPILLYFVLSSSQRQAWLALTAGMLSTLTAATIFVFVEQLPGSYQSWLIDKNVAFMEHYYFNTLPRASPFFVGMVFGYILHFCRQRKPKFSKSTVLLLWWSIIVMGTLSFYSPEPTKDINHKNQTMVSLINAFARPVWAFAVASLVVVCVNGYGGPVNWFLSLQFWKMISRVSYAMYLFHFPLILLIVGSSVQPVYFSVYEILYEFFSIFFITFIVGFFATMIIELPCSTLINRVLGKGLKSPQTESVVKSA